MHITILLFLQFAIDNYFYRLIFQKFTSVNFIFIFNYHMQAFKFTVYNYDLFVQQIIKIIFVINFTFNKWNNIIFK